jgi:hypothetical protein
MPSKITVIKLIHSAIWLVMATAVFYILYCGITGNLNPLVYWAIGLILVETAVLLLNHGACPLTTVAQEVKPDWQDGDDIFLPTWLAVHNKTIFGLLFTVGVILVVFRLLAQQP